LHRTILVTHNFKIEDRRRKVVILLAILAINIVMVALYQRQEAFGSFFDDFGKIFKSKPSVMEGFSLYENPIQKASIQYPSNWDKHEIFGNDYTAVVEFIIPSDAPFAKFAKSSNLETLLQQMRNASSIPLDKVILRVKSLPIEETTTLQNITNDEKQSLGFSFSNFSLLTTSYDTKIGEIPASKLIYTYEDSGMDQKGMLVNAVSSYKAIFVSYSSVPQDFDKFLPTVYKMIDSFKFTK
jgi:hypothetical protein